MRSITTSIARAMRSTNRALALKPRVDGGGLGHACFKFCLPGGQRVRANYRRHYLLDEIPPEVRGEPVFQPVPARAFPQQALKVALVGADPECEFGQTKARRLHVFFDPESDALASVGKGDFLVHEPRQRLSH